MLKPGMIFKGSREQVLFIILKIEPMDYGNYSKVYFLASDTQEIEIWPTDPELIQDHQRFAKSLVWTYINDNS